MKLIFIRHGDPNYAIDSLTEKGWREAELLSHRVCKWDVTEFFCSPLGRARDTAGVSLKKLGREAKVLDWLQEFPPQIDDPRTGRRREPWDLLPADWTRMDKFFSGEEWLDTDLMKTGPVQEKFEAVKSGIDELLHSYGYERDGHMYRTECGNEETLVFFCHFGVICVLLSHLLGVPTPILWHSYALSPTSVTTLVTQEEEKGLTIFRCTAQGDTAHLYVADEPVSLAGMKRETCR